MIPNIRWYFVTGIGHNTNVTNLGEFLKITATADSDTIDSVRDEMRETFGPSYEEIRMIELFDNDGNSVFLFEASDDTKIITTAKVKIL